MKKLQLDVDTLRVESFVVAPGGTAKDGVHAHSITLRVYCPLPSDPTCLINSCGGADSYCECGSHAGEGGTCAVSCRSEPCVCIPQPA